MWILVAILLPVLALSLGLFFRTTPKVENPLSIRRYNVGVLVVGLSLCGLYAFRVHSLFMGTTDAAWWPVLCFLGSLLILPATLLLGGVVRNHVLFRRRNA